MAAVPLTEFAVHLRPQDNIAVCPPSRSPANTDIAFDGATIRVAQPDHAWGTSSRCGQSRKATRF